MAMRILVAHASRHGATAVIATVVGRVLSGSGHTVEVLPVEEVVDPALYDAVVVGSAVYRGRWLCEAVGFVRDHHEVLAARPVWLFSSGPLSSTAVAAPVELPELERAVQPRGHAVFPGALEADQLTRRERLFRCFPRARRALPEGDFRDWDDVESWASTIARNRAKPVQSAQIRP
jgi:menaquinone-dependent protoporphyrinogen oxidase